MLFVAKQNITALLQIQDFLNTVHVISILIENMCINTKKKETVVTACNASCQDIREIQVLR